MKSKRLLKVAAWLLLILFLPVHYAFSARYYVASDGAGSGTSWADALGDIQSAIDLAVFGDEVWVKTGTYKPHVSDRTVSITLKSGVRLYGGFQGTETILEDRLLNDNDANGFIEPWEFLYLSTLSGEIQGDGMDTNNSNHILIVPDGADATTLINGFTVILGYSDALSITPHGTNYYASGVVALGGEIENCLVENCKNESVGISYGAGLFAYNSKVVSCAVVNCSISAKESYGGGMVVIDSRLSKSKVKGCNLTSSITGRSIGGGVYAQGAVVDSCQISSCTAIPLDDNRASGGGMYSSSSHILNCIIDNCSVSGVQGFGGGINSISSTYVNTIVNNCEATVSGGGLYSISCFYTNCDVVNNKVTGTNAIGGGAYGDGATAFYNTVFWGNETSGTSAQLRLDAGGVANNCAAQTVDLTGNNNINISSDNSGAVAGTWYPKFILPTNFTGTAGGDITKEANLLMANWNIEKSSSLIEMGDNGGFSESAFSDSEFGVVFDLNGNGNKFDNIDNFYDEAKEARLFNLKVDIGAYESVFVDLILPSTQTIEYGLTLGEITISDGSAIDNRDGSNVLGSYAFTDVSVMPAVTGVNEKFRVSFTPDDLTKYPVSYDSVMVIVTAKNLSLSGLVSENKQYDGNISATHSGTAALEGIVGSDDVSLNMGSVVATYSDKHVGVNKTVSYSGFSLSGADKSNYILSVPTTLSSITAKTISILPLTANDKVYDGDNLATYSGIPTLTGTISGDDVSIDLTNQSSIFTNKNIGVGKTVTYSGFALMGADKGNYTLTQPISSTADITKLEVKVAGVGAEDKIYNGLTTATITGVASVNGLISGDAVSLNSTVASANFDTKDVGNDKPVSFSNYSLDGADGVNYTLVQPTSVTATINSKELVVTGLSVVDKDYDATSGATFTGTPLLDGVILSENVSLNSSFASAAFSDANAGVDKEVNFSGYSLAGVDKGNYHLTQPVLLGDIRTINISIVADAKSKTYDQVVDPVLSYQITSGGLIGSDVFTGALSRDTGEDAGTYHITQGSLSLSNNYVINFTGNTFVINKAENVIDFSLESPIVFELDKTIMLSASSSSQLPVIFSSSDESVASITGNTLTVKSYGSVEITASQSGDNNYETATPGVVNLVITLNIEALRKGDKMLLVNNIQGQFKEYKWYQNNTLIAGATKQFYYSEQGLTGEYYCMVTTEKGDQFMSNKITSSSTKSMEIYPSPAVAGGNINVALKGFDANEEEGFTIKVYSITGNLVQTIFQAKSLNNLNIQKSGIYMIRAEGEANLTQKIIVK